MEKYNFSGDIHFVTTRTFKNKEYFKDEKCCELFLGNLDKLRNELKFKIFGYCIMPNHVHLLIQLQVDDICRVSGELSVPGVTRVTPNSFGEQRRAPNEFGVTQEGYVPNEFGVTQEAGYAPNEFSVTREGNISYIVKRIKGASARGINKQLKQKGSFWNHGFYDFNIYSPKKFNEKLNYIHNNPIKANLTDDISSYKYCSWKNYELADHSLFEIDFVNF